MMRITLTGKGKGRVLIEYEGPLEVMDLREQPSLLPLNALSGREKEVLPLLLEGHTYPQIGEKLFISPYTVKAHVRHIYEKCQVNSRAQLLHLFLEYLPFLRNPAAMSLKGSFGRKGEF
jgi:DNA-binding NarL/FixJ family response regulator